MSRPLKRATSKPLFVGSTVHQLSAEDRALLRDVFVPTEHVSQTDVDKIEAGIDTAANTPAGVAKLRQIIEHKRQNPDFRVAIDTSPEIDMELQANNSWGRTTDNVPSKRTRGMDASFYIELSSSTLSNSETLANILVHEGTHGMQGIDGDKTHRVLADAETQAFDAQIGLEVSRKNGDYDPIYAERFEESRKKWERIARNPNKTPPGALPFQQMPGTNREEAIQAYSHQMASEEMQRQYTRDFVRSPENWDSNSLNSPDLIEEQQHYRRQTIEEDADEIDSDVLAGINARTGAGITKDDITATEGTTTRPGGMPFSKKTAGDTALTYTAEMTLDARDNPEEVLPHDRDTMVQGIQREAVARQGNKNDRIAKIINNGLADKVAKGQRLTHEESAALNYISLNNNPALSQEDYNRGVAALYQELKESPNRGKYRHIINQMGAEMRQSLRTQESPRPIGNTTLSTLRSAENNGNGPIRNASERPTIDSNGRQVESR